MLLTIYFCYETPKFAANESKKDNMFYSSKTKNRKDTIGTLPFVSFAIVLSYDTKN
jgi:hypothetical protein